MARRAPTTNAEFRRSFSPSHAAVVVAVTAIARRLRAPPILQVAAGFLVRPAAGRGDPRAGSDLVFFVFLPPVLWAAAFFPVAGTSRTVIDRPAGVGLVLATTVAVAVTARALFRRAVGRGGGARRVHHRRTPSRPRRS
jgi:integral membrane sensor domain MASE1